MSKMLVLNPVRGKRKSRKAPSAKQKANWARFARMARAKSAGSKRASNPASALTAYRRKRRSASRSTVATSRRRRRRNPISMGKVFNLRSYIAPIKDAAIMGGGAVFMDLGYGYLSRYLPPSMQVVPGRLGVGNAIKALLTVAIGRVLAGPTKGLSNKAAMGALVVQARDATLALIPPGAIPGLGWYNPTPVVNMNTRAGLTRNGMGAFTTGRTPSLAAFAPSGSPSPILSTQRLRTSARHSA